MATTRDPKSNEGEERARSLYGPGPRRLRWTVDQYYRLAELGFFRNKRVELIEGDIIVMAPIKPPHSIAVELLDSVLRTAFGPGHRIRIQQPIDLGAKSEPEPDALVLAGDPRDASEHPRNALLVIEVSDTSLRYDRRRKAHLYAQAGIADYWIVNLVDRQLEILRNPGPDPTRPGRYAYAATTTVPADGSATPLAAPGAAVAVADLLP